MPTIKAILIMSNDKKNNEKEEDQRCLDRKKQNIYTRESTFALLDIYKIFSALV